MLDLYSLVFFKESNKCDWFAMLIKSIGCNKPNLLKLRRYDNYIYVKQKCLYPAFAKILVCYFKSIIVDVNITF